MSLFFIATLIHSYTYKLPARSKALFFFILCSLSIPAYAGGDGGITKTVGKMLEGARITTGANMNPMQYTPETNEISSEVKIVNNISLTFNESLVGLDDFDASIEIGLLYGESQEDAAAKGPVYRTLMVSYKKGEGVKYNLQNRITFEGAKYVRVVIKSAPNSGFVSSTATPSVIRSKLILLNEMTTTRYYDLSDNNVPAPEYRPNQTLFVRDGEFVVGWKINVQPGNNATQIEWTWVDDDMIGLYTQNGVVNTDLLFRNNASRVEVSPDVNQYSIPLLYPDTGYLYYRVRFVNVKKNGSRSDGPWSEVKRFRFFGHENDLNWQVTTTYAEEGKRKSVIQYYDGSLRSRQTVTKTNTDSTIVVAETMYDGQGRPAVQVLPSPEMSKTIAYIRDLNLFNGQSGSEQNPADLFDLKTPSLPLTLQNFSGASRYYSASNDELADPLNPTYSKTTKIPDAAGYPYTLTRYTQDGTGRIQSQSGVGETFRMDNHHETKYFYGSPTQEELDGLFGTEVGNASHYFKNMVQDANGQMSISYVDMHGRTIATALAGDAPQGMQALLPDAANYPNQQAQTIKKNLLKSDANRIKDNNRLESVNTLLVPYTTLHTFTYELTPAALQAEGCNNVSACYDCLYNLEISITDESDETDPVLYTFSNISLNPDNDCTTNPSLLSYTGKPDNSVSVAGKIITITKTLPAGSYTVRKTLYVSESGLEQQKQAYLAKVYCNKTENLVMDALIDSVYQIYKGITACNITPLPLPNDCPNNLCNTDVSHTLESIKFQMLADMLPYSGQYAANELTAPHIDNSLFKKYNIFSSNGYSSQPFYLHPAQGVGDQDPFYKDIYGNKDPIWYPTGNESSNLTGVSKQDFQSRFSQSWANQLLPYHPEYARYAFAVANLQLQYEWGDHFSNTATYNEAVGQYVYKGGSTGVPYTDNFYTIKANSVERDTMESWVKTPTTGQPSYQNTGLSMWQIASGNVTGCKLIADPTERLICYKNTLVPENPSFETSLSTEIKDAIWNNFKLLYANERANLINKYIARNVSSPDAQLLAIDRYLLHFPDSRQQTAQVMNWEGYPPVEGEAPSIPEDQNDATDVYNGRCSAYIDQWKAKLLQCATLAVRADKDAILNEITSRMKAVCLAGSDDANPFGSSTVKPGSTNTDQSFEAVIQDVFKKYGIIGSNGVYADGYCNPFVIDYPKPYNKAELVTPEYITILKECNSTRFYELQQQAVIANPQYNANSLADFNAFLVSKFGAGSEISQEMFDGLRDFYSNAQTQIQTGTEERTVSYPTGSTNINCDSYCSPKDPAGCTSTVLTCPVYAPVVVLSSPQILPRFLQCGSDNTSLCHTCGELQSLTAEFKTLFSGNTTLAAAPVTGTANLTDAQVDANVVWERFMNYRTGLQETWRTYTTWANANGCTLTGSGSTNTISVICGRTLPLNDTTGVFVKADPCAHTYAMAVDIAQNIFKARKQQLLADFDASYRNKCLSSVSGEKFAVQYINKEYHYTLYYYDQAGNLVKTVPPKGVRPDFTNTNAVEQAKANDTELPRPHVLVTQYRYNSLNEVIAQNTPDGGTSQFWYDKLGRLAVSQNAKQATANKWSYTVYDPLGRIVEVGQKSQSDLMIQTTSQDDENLRNWLLGGGAKEQITYTHYDNPYMDDPKSLDTYIRFQQNLRNRVSYTMVKNLETDPIQYAATFYTYDVHGNVDTLLQDFRGLDAMNGTSNRFKRIIYDYDLISGKVNAVDYQPKLLNLHDINNENDDTWDKQTDAFYHRYSYDAENRLTEVQTSRDKLVWETDATYSYYKHGPLARMVTGALQVQGTDYVYTLQGWLKGVNGMGDADGSTGSAVAKDAYSFQLNYYNNDYTGLNGINPSAGLVQQLNNAFKPLYNGNIAAMAVDNDKLFQPMVYNYGYDQLNRLRTMDAFEATSNAWTSLTVVDRYKEAITYDPNGNIITYKRNGADKPNLPKEMDDLAYNYKPNTNLLTSISDNTAYTNNYTTAQNNLNDIDNQSANNYGYDEIGNMVSDVQAGITGTNGIVWNVYGKILSIAKSGSTITYAYDAAGNRISKTVGTTVTTYVRDAQGNVMAVYQREGSGALINIESHLYGTSRIGIVGKQTVANTSIPLSGVVNGAGEMITFTRGEKAYELTNHLGNVLVTISDKRLPYSSDGTTVAYYKPDVITASDYYPFGMLQPGRNVSAANYRYGFNGKENDNEVKGEGNQQDYGMRIYDPRVGRFYSVDPITKDYPELTPYQFASNRPIDGVDQDGLEWAPPLDKNGKVDTKVTLEITHANADMSEGLLESGKSTIQGLRQLVRHPINTIKASIEAALHPAKTFNAIKTQTVKDYNDNAAKANGKMLGNVLQFFYGGELFKKSTIAKEAAAAESVVKTARGEAFFWSGRTEGIGGAERALQIAKLQRGTTLEGLIESRGIKMPEWDINNPASIKAWEKISAEYAANVSGKIRAVVGAELRPGNIWENVELPALKQNKSVTEIITIDPKTLKETTIFKR